MKIKLFLLAAVLLLTTYCQLCFAQDFIVKKTGDEMKAKVIEVMTSEIKYKKFDNLDGPSYTISKSEVFMIRYANGEKDVFKEEEKKPIVVEEKKQTSSSSNDLRIEGDLGRYYQNNSPLPLRDVYNIIKESGNNDAIREIRASKLTSVGKVLFVIGLPFAGAGVLLTGVGISFQVDGPSSPYYDPVMYEEGVAMTYVGIPLAAIGTAAWITGIVLKRKGKNHIREAVRLYNAGLGK